MKIAIKYSSDVYFVPVWSKGLEELIKQLEFLEW